MYLEYWLSERVCLGTQYIEEARDGWNGACDENN